MTSKEFVPPSNDVTDSALLRLIRTLGVDGAVVVAIAEDPDRKGSYDVDVIGKHMKLDLTHQQVCNILRGAIGHLIDMVDNDPSATKLTWPDIVDRGQRPS